LLLLQQPQLQTTPQYIGWDIVTYGPVKTVKLRPTNTLCKYMIVAGKSEENNLTSSNSSEKDRIDILKEREEAKRRILEENPNIAKDTLEFMLSLPKERKIPKVTELETIHATAEQQKEMERLLKKKNEE
jgi:hypothetical protein